MSREKLKTQLWAAILAFVAGVGAMGCLISGMELALTQTGWLIASCAISAVVFSMCARRKLAWLPLCLLGLLAVYLWLKGPLEQSAEALVFAITEWYDAGYGWGAIHWTGEDPTLADPAQVLCFIGAFVTAAVAWTVAGGYRGWFGILVAVLPLSACLVLTNTVPAEVYLFCLMAAVVLIMITQPLRRKEEAQGNTLTAMVAIPVAAAVLILFLVCPQDSYNGQAGADRLEQWVRTVFNLEEELPIELGVTGDHSDKNVSLDAVGPKTYQNKKVMSVINERGGLLYLRGCAYDIYDGHSWSCSDGEWAADGNFSVDGKAWKVTVSTSQPHRVLYMPNVVASNLKRFKGGRLDNPDEKTRYQFVCTQMPTYKMTFPTLSAVGDSSYTGSSLGGLLYSDAMNQYLMLPEGTAEAARQWVEDRLGPVPQAGSAQMQMYVYGLVELVRESADYDLQTRRMSGDAADFAMWFLEESNTGYCVHYATAATVLLRSIGIPARYVTGYLVQTKANVSTNVRLRDAHAWVEIYDAQQGWLMVEPTPSGFGSPVPEPTVVQPTGETQQQEAQTQPPTEQTEPVTEPITEPTEAPATTETTQSSTEASQTDDEDEQQPPAVLTPGTKQTSGGGLVWLLILVLVVASVILQWQLRLWLRRRKQRIGTPNAQALARWQEISLYKKLSKSVPEELEQIALKAKFSQHTLTRQELHQLDGYIVRTRNQLRQGPIAQRIYAALILAII